MIKRSIVKLTSAKVHSGRLPLSGAFYWQESTGQGWFGPFPSPGRAQAASERGEGVCHAIVMDWEHKAQRLAIPASLPEPGAATALMVRAEVATVARVASKPKSHPKLATPRNITNRLGAQLISMGLDLLKIADTGTSEQVVQRVEKTLACFDSNEAESVRSLMAGILESQAEEPSIQAEAGPDLGDEVVARLMTASA